MFAPLANRLGVWQLKWELEDSQPARARARRRTSASRSCSTSAGVDRQRYIDHVDRDAALTSSPAPASRPRSRGRPKHIYSIWNKMQPQAGRHRGALRHPRGAHPRRRRSRIATRRSAIVHHLWTPLPQRVRRLHREAEGEQLPLAAHGGDRARGQAARGADPHAGHASALRVRRRGALALQGGRRQGHASRSRLRRQDRVAAAGARLEGRRRRMRANGSRRFRAASSPIRSTC